MSNKNRKKNHFDAPSHTAEIYLDTFEKSKSGETSAPLGVEDRQEIVTSTDAPSGNLIIPNLNTKTREMPNWIKHFLSWAPFLIPILWFSWSLNATINDVKSKTTVLENKIDNTFIGQGDIKLTLEKIIGKIDRLLDKVLSPQK